MSKASPKPIRFRILTGLIILILAFLSFQIWKRDQLPDGTLEMEKLLKTIQSKQKKWVMKIIDSPTLEKREEAAREYLSISGTWESEVQTARSFFKKHLKGKTMRVKARLAGKSLEARKLLTIIKESRLMFQNALKGKLDERHKGLLKFESKRAFEKLFLNMKPSKSSP